MVIRKGHWAPILLELNNFDRLKEKRPMRNLYIIVLLGSIFLVSLALFPGCGGEDNPVDPTNHPPVISSMTASMDTVNLSDTCTITCVATDQDGDSLTYNWSSAAGSISGTGNSAIWTSPNVGGAYTVVCEVSDGNAAAVTDSVTIMVTRLMPAQGLILHYPFDGNANDASGNSNHGTVYDATLTQDRYNNDNSAYAFDGSGDYIDIGNNVKPLFPMSISAWVKIDSIAAGGCIFRNDEHNQTANRYGVGIFYRNTGQIISQVYEGFSISSNRMGKVSTDSVMTINEWNHVVVMFTAYNNHKHFWNSVEITGDYIGTGSGMTYSNSSGAIGKSSLSTYAVDGRIDDIRVYDRALSAEEIGTLFLEGQ
jgi:hypothetical protein